MNQEELNQKAKDAVLAYDLKECVSIAKEAISSGADLMDLVHNGFTRGIRIVGDLFQEKKSNLAHIMASAEAMNAGIDILTPEIKKSGDVSVSELGKFVICTVQGDIHSIGKDIVAVMMNIAGFEVINLGRDVPIEEVVEAAKEHKPLAIGTSALMTTTIMNQKVLEEALIRNGLRNGVITNVGGAPVTQQWCDEIGADVYSENAADCVKKMIAAIVNS
ncbi:MAG: cobalamin B12-binding domain-containing protein [Candidatus Methanomethylophilaceae archaeon]